MNDKYGGLRKATLLIASTMTVMAGAIIAPALPQLSREFAGVPGVELLSRLVLTLPALFMAVLAPLAGHLVDRKGRKKVLLFSLVLYAVAGTSGLYLNTLPAILVGRAILGIANGALVTAVITLIGDYFEGPERSRFLGLQAAFSGMGGIVFISMGGILADIHWRAPFLLYVLSLVVFVMAIISVFEPSRPGFGQPHYKNRVPEGETRIPGLILGIYAMAFVSAIVFYMIPTQLPFMLSAIDGVTNTEIGFAIAFVNLASVTTSLLYNRVRRVLNYSNIMGVVYTLVFAGFFIISTTQTYIIIIAGISLAGFGFGLMMPNVNLWLISEAPAHMRGRLVGYLNAAFFSGLFISPIAIQPLINVSSLYSSFKLVGFIVLLLGAGMFLYDALNRNR